MIVDERGKPFRPPFDWSGGELGRLRLDSWREMQMRENLRLSGMMRMLKFGGLRAVAEECQRWENKGALPPPRVVKFRMEGRYE